MEKQYMPILGLSIIAESINDSIPSTKELFDRGDSGAIVELARSQAQAGAAYIDVNVGSREPAFMAEVVVAIQAAVSVRLSIDSPSFDIQAAAFAAYDKDRAGGMPVVNSVSELRPDFFELNTIIPCMPILMCTERLENSGPMPNKTAPEIHATAQRLAAAANAQGIPNERLIIDPGLAPIGADYEYLTKATLGAMALIHSDPILNGVHMSVGLSNFTQMLPPKRKDGGLVKTPLESAFITLAMPRGLDHVIGSMRKKYRILSPGDEALMALNEAIVAGGMDTIARIKKFYK